MSVGSLNRINAALGSGKLQDDERLILADLVEHGYGEDDKPLGRAGMRSSDDLAAAVYPLLWESPSPNWSEERSRIEGCKRRVRKAINRLIIVHGISISCVAGFGGGYYLPATKEDVEENHRRFHKRAMTGLVKAARGRTAAYADSMIQLTLGFEDEARASLDLSPSAADGPPAWVQVVTGLLQKVRGNPEKYAAEIRRIQDACGDIFVRRDKVARIRHLSSELNRALEALQSEESA
jgi:hypothetical protein